MGVIDKNEGAVEKESGAKAKKWILAGIAIVALMVLCVFVTIQCVSKDEPEVEVITVSSLQKIINVSELSTLTAVYNGVAEVMDEEKPEEVSYYVSYEAKVEAGIDFENIKISMDEENKKIKVDMPEIFITEINVDIGSLDFIFVNSKANASTVTQEAFKACEADVQNESEKQEAIYNLAQQNAENVLTALIKPIVEQWDSEYTLVIE